MVFQRRNFKEELKIWYVPNLRLQTLTDFKIVFQFLEYNAINISILKWKKYYIKQISQQTYWILLAGIIINSQPHDTLQPLVTIQENLPFVVMPFTNRLVLMKNTRKSGTEKSRDDQLQHWDTLKIKSFNWLKEIK